MIFWSFVIVGVLIKRRGRALRNPGQLRARPRLSLRPYDTKCPIKYQLLQQDSHISRRPGAILDAVDNDSHGGPGRSQLIERSCQIAEELGADAPDKVKAALLALFC